MTVAVAEPRVRPEWDYLSEPKEHVTACNLCGHEKFAQVSTHERAGYPAPCCVCLRCGLGFLTPRLTAKAYAEFYSSGMYRRVVEFATGERPTQNHQGAKAYAQGLYQFLAPFFPTAAKTLLDIGGGPGVTASIFAERAGVVATVLDPSGEPCAVENVALPLEYYEAPPYDVVLMCQTVDHLHDLADGLRKARALVSENGLFFVDIVDFLTVVRQTKNLQAATKLDHPYYMTDWLTEAILPNFGFEVLRKRYAGRHVGYACRPVEPAPRVQRANVRNLLSNILRAVHG